MLKRLKGSPRSNFLRSRVGFTLMEVVIAVAILALILAAVTPVLVLITNYRFHWNEQRVAENLARNHIEYVKVRPYIEANATDPNPVYVFGNEPALAKPNASWDIYVTAVPVLLVTDATGNTTREVIDFDPLGEVDQGIQEIQVAVYHVDKLILETTDYKVDRPEIWRE